MLDDGSRGGAFFEAFFKESGYMGRVIAIWAWHLGFFERNEEDYMEGWFLDFSPYVVCITLSVNSNI